MKGSGARFAMVFIAATVIVIMTALVVQTTRGPTFRAADHENMADCIANIPREWRPGSLEYDGAEAACYYVHVRDRQGDQ